MRYVTLLTALLFLSLQVSRSCFFGRAASHPTLRSNQAFLNEVGERYSSMTEAEYNDLVSRYLNASGGSSSGPRPERRNPNPTELAPILDRRTYSVSTGGRYNSDFRNLRRNPELVARLDEFIDAVQRPGGLREIQRNSNSWNFERLTQEGPNAHSVRLNRGYRILFDLDPITNSIHIRAVRNRPGH